MLIVNRGSEYVCLEAHARFLIEVSKQVCSGKISLSLPKQAGHFPSIDLTGDRPGLGKRVKGR